MEREPGWQEGEEQEQPVPEWQRETWISPYPMHENPFDEPEDAPELRELRSEELNNRSGEFWQTQTSGYTFGQGTGAQKPVEKKKEEKPEEKRKKRIWMIGGSLLAVAAVLLVLYYGVFVVRAVVVTGNDEIPVAEIIRLSGIQAGTPLLGMDIGEIERSIETNVYLKFRYLEKDYTSGVVTLRVQEREACCWMIWNGILYTMDKQRTVLFESEDLTIQPAELVQVDGLRIRSGTQVGQTLALENAEQQVVFNDLFLEMKVLDCTWLIEEADLSNLNSLLLTTRDGFTIAMGNSNDIHAKLRAMLLTREELLRRDYHGGVINVTLPETPIFSPSGT